MSFQLAYLRFTIAHSKVKVRSYAFRFLKVVKAIANVVEQQTRSNITITTEQKVMYGFSIGIFTFDLDLKVKVKVNVKVNVKIKFKVNERCHD